MRMWRRRRRRGTRAAPLRAGEIIGPLLDRHGASRELREHRVAARWPAIVGPRIAGRTVPDGLSKGVLWIRVSSSAWLHQLSFLRETIVEKVNEALGDPPLVREVRFHLGGRRADADDALAPTMRLRRAPPARRALPAPATGERLREIEAETANVSDPELRAAILEARRKLNR